jgi:hypothetical protein
MIRALSILAAVAALAVSVVPAASATVVLIGANNYGIVVKPPPRGTDIVTDNKDPDKLARPANGIIAILIG